MENLFGFCAKSGQMYVEIIAKDIKEAILELERLGFREDEFYNYVFL